MALRLMSFLKNKFWRTKDNLELNNHAQTQTSMTYVHSLSYLSDFDSFNSSTGYQTPSLLSPNLPNSAEHSWLTADSENEDAQSSSASFRSFRETEFVNVHAYPSKSSSPSFSFSSRDSADKLETPMESSPMKQNRMDAMRTGIWCRIWHLKKLVKFPFYYQENAREEDERQKLLQMIAVLYFLLCLYIIIGFTVSALPYFMPCWYLDFLENIGILPVPVIKSLKDDQPEIKHFWGNINWTQWFESIKYSIVSVYEFLQLDNLLSSLGLPYLKEMIG